MPDTLLRFWTMTFPKRLVTLRKAKGLTQARLAEIAEIHIQQIKRYELGQAQPALDALIKLARALAVSTDELLFEEGSRGPDAELRLQFEALSRFSPEEKKVAKAVLDSLILQHEAKRWASTA